MLVSSFLQLKYWLNTPSFIRILKWMYVMGPSEENDSEGLDVKCGQVYVGLFCLLVSISYYYLHANVVIFPWIPLRRKWLEALKLYLYNLDKMIEMWCHRKKINISDFAALKLILQCAIGGEFSTLNRFFFQINNICNLSFPLSCFLCLFVDLPHADTYMLIPKMFHNN